eukprot:scaffold48513_cov63-Phaeocystis_antarctica.AAC.7
MLAPGWEALESSDGTYYYNEATNETSWDFPAAVAAGDRPRSHPSAFSNCLTTPTYRRRTAAAGMGGAHRPV